MRLLTKIAAAALAVALTATAASAQGVVVSSKIDTEGGLLGNIISQVLQANGVPVTEKIQLGATSVVRQAITAGQIDLYPEYTGTGLNAVMKAQGVTETDPGKIHEMVRAYYEKEFKLTWLKPSGVNNGYAIIVRPETAREMNLKTLSDLAKVAPKLKLGAGPEFADRRDGIKGMKEVYGIEFGEFRQFAALRLRYDALSQKQIDVANGFATDWQIAAEKFAALDDDRKLFPPYYLAAVIRLEAAANPKIVEAIERVGAVIDNVTMQELNRQVEVEKKEPRQVAAAFLKAKGIAP